MWGMIATWRMALEGVTQASETLKAGASATQSVVSAVAEVEDFPFYKSVGYGGLPTENGEVELDAAFMDGDTLAFGAVGNLVDIANPVKVAQALSRELQEMESAEIEAGQDAALARSASWKRVKMLHGLGYPVDFGWLHASTGQAC